MDSIFVAQTFDPKDRELLSEIDKILFSHGVQRVTGHNPGGQALDEGIKKLIRESDCLVALATQRDQKVGGSWTTHPWVLNEYSYAKEQNKPAIALVEEGVDWSGMYAGHHFIPLLRARPTDALLQLSNTIGYWKEAAGETWKLQILPEALAEQIEVQAGHECAYRTVQQGAFSDWCPIDPVAEPGGVFLYVKGLTDRHMVEVRIRGTHGTWKSPATPKWMPVTLKELQ